MVIIDKSKLGVETVSKIQRYPQSCQPSKQRFGAINISTNIPRIAFRSPGSSPFLLVSLRFFLAVKYHIHLSRLKDRHPRKLFPNFISQPSRYSYSNGFLNLYSVTQSNALIVVTSVYRTQKSKSSGDLKNPLPSLVLGLGHQFL